MFKPFNAFISTCEYLIKINNYLKTIPKGTLIPNGKNKLISTDSGGSTTGGKGPVDKTGKRYCCQISDS